MALLRLALPVLAAAGSAYAACSASGTATIQNAGDATAIASCTTYSGSIAVATGMADDINFGSTLEQISGDLIIENNANIQRIDAAGMKTVTGEFRLNDDSQLAAVSFPKLTEVKTLTLTGLASLRSLTAFNLSKCDKLDVENTKLESLTGIDLGVANVITIANNPSIANISMKVTNITGALDLSFNNADVTVAFPFLQTAQNISIRAVANLSLPALGTVTPGSFGIFNSKMESFYAPNLTSIKDSLSIVNNTALKDLSFASLQTVGASFLIENNTALSQVNKLPKLSEVGAALDISGNLTDVESPSLTFVKGVFNLQSTADLGNSCTFYDGLRDKGKIPKNKYKCAGELATAGTAGTSSGSSNGTKTSAATPLLNMQPAYISVAGLFAVLFM